MNSSFNKLLGGIFLLQDTWPIGGINFASRKSPATVSSCASQHFVHEARKQMTIRLPSIYRQHQEYGITESFGA